MTLFTVTVGVLVGTLFLYVAAGATLVDRADLAAARQGFTENVRAVLPYVGLLGTVLFVNRVAREAGPDLSWVLGWNVTDELYAVEGTFVASVQSVQSPWVTGYFSFVYLPGYVFLLTFPVLLYVASGAVRPLKETVLSYTVNYSLGLVCYVLFISYGPRNMLPDMVDPLLYSTYPDTQLLTGEVNSNSNVFPSLHASLSTTVAVLSLRHRETSRRWMGVAVFGAVNVAVATMYLGIHWATDVVAGVVLGVGSVVLAAPGVDWEEGR
jgi:membrane-associated phospholipid phosphatase